MVNCQICGEEFIPPQICVICLRSLQIKGMKSRCKSCGRRIVFHETHKGKLAPFTMEGVNHFVDCPGAEKFRKKNESDMP